MVRQISKNNILLFQSSLVEVQTEEDVKCAYVRRLKFGNQIGKAIPPMLCLAVKNAAVLTETTLWKPFYTDDTYDCDLAPSNPDEKLCNDLAKNKVWDYNNKLCIKSRNILFC
ncbi:MAG: hypothetical protein LBR51_00720 [Bacteroidales bacterium]|jgi:hypothetical protein|nr:hypothetical protein [Bacteroidales bacterium]